MQKQTFILIIVFILGSGCSVLKRAGRSGNLGTNGSNSIILPEQLKNQNITNAGFFITKAELEVSGIDGNEKLICSIKYVYPDTYLVSIRNRTGIEAARIFLSNDTVFVNDRINRRLYFGSNKQMIEKYGFNQSVIPLIMGDYLTEDLVSSESEGCIGGLFKKQDRYNGLLINYTIDCRILKVIAAAIEKGNSFNLEFSRFMRLENILIPEEIKIEDLEKMTKISIRIVRIEYPWNGSIEFIPGSGYEKIPLL